MSKWPYNTAAWRKLRLAQLRAEPLCRYCTQFDPSRPVPADVVDHIRPHRGDRDMAFDPDNLQSLCKPCHDKHGQAKDEGLPVAGCGPDGMPLDATHPWGEG